jgi:hypothetical protein
VRAAVLTLVLGCAGAGEIDRLEATSLDRIGASYEPARRGHGSTARIWIDAESSWHQARVSVHWVLEPGAFAIVLRDGWGRVVGQRAFARAGCHAETTETGACRDGWAGFVADEVVEVTLTTPAGSLRVPLDRIRGT